MIPQRKVTAGLIAGAIIGVSFWVAKLITGKPVPITLEEYSMLNVLVVFAVQWWVKNHPSAPVESDDTP